MGDSSSAATLSDCLPGLDSQVCDGVNLSASSSSGWGSLFRRGTCWITSPVATDLGDLRQILAFPKSQSLQVSGEGAVIPAQSCCRNHWGSG